MSRTVSEKQLAANRANAKKSTGPRTPEGKARSSQNARRHEVTAQTLIMTEEDRKAHDAFIAGMMTDLAPIGAMETFLAESVAEEAWRLNHALSGHYQVENKLPVAEQLPKPEITPQFPLAA